MCTEIYCTYLVLRKNMLGDMDPENEVPLPDEEMASIFPILEAAYGPTLRAPVQTQLSH